jgi:hypothetical protein
MHTLRQNLQWHSGYPLLGIHDNYKEIAQKAENEYPRKF